MTIDERAAEFAYECPDCGEPHDGMTTGTEWCPDCEEDRHNRPGAED